ncbi:acyl-ACP--UDP-N-acetylglucosamine O-acyltransferase [Chitinispirillales bacterium ANBcel5]|uniref:acyl-ACP--UDP-N-acetylglucosamine O-acyltransferase n=1 Tax=Cellulosispirillum alkaliphilum TaxID=3039283 RepID=UPI002A50C005|nr:acyl-ACP--UDP-N-acetylglucosamine O-acyltransferase [Chitinispirillales bacterium ANBcel5]
MGCDGNGCGSFSEFTLNKKSGIHPTAIIEPGAQIGENVTIGPYTVIESDVVIGAESTIGPHVVIGNGTRIGNKCKIFKGASIGLEPQDKKYAGEKTFTIIGDNTLIREFVTVNRGTTESMETRIGSDCWIMAYCHIAHDCVIGNDVTISNGLAMAGHVEVGNHVTIGGIVPIHQFTRIGDYAMVASVARPFTDVVPYALVGADPTRIAGINSVGLERRGYSQEQIKHIKKAYKILFRMELSLNAAIEKLQEEYKDNKDVMFIVDFVKKSQRGIMRMGKDM